MNGFGHGYDVLCFAKVRHAVRVADYITSAGPKLAYSLLYLGIDFFRRAFGQRIVYVYVADKAQLISVLLFEL